jgi:hypothetical protein
MTVFAYIPDPKLVHALHPEHLSEEFLALLIAVTVFILMVYLLGKVVLYLHPEG